MCVRRSCRRLNSTSFFFFFQAEDGIRDGRVTGVQTCALPILSGEEPRLWNTTHVYMHKSALGHGGDFFGDGQRLFRARANRSEERRVGKSVDLGGRRIIKKKKKKKNNRQE